MPLRGRTVLALGACGIDVEPDGDRLHRLFAPLPEPLIDTFAVRSATGLSRIREIPSSPVPALGDGRMLARPDPATTLRILRAARIGAAGPLQTVELRHLGGRAAEARAPGALTTLPGEFLLNATGLAPDAELEHSVDAALDRVAKTAAPVDHGCSVAGFRGGRTDAPGALRPPDHDRLRELRLSRDPAGRLHRPREVAR